MARGRVAEEEIQRGRGAETSRQRQRQRQMQKDRETVRHRAILVQTVTASIANMLSKRALGCDELRVSPNKRFRMNAADLFLSNTISASRAASMFADAAAAGAEGVGDLVMEGSGKNTHRNLVRKLLKHSKWPSVYFAAVPVWNRKTVHKTEAQVPMLLPHEVVAALYANRVDDEAFFETTNLDNVGRRHLDAVAREIGSDGPVMGLGLWLDGVAAKWDRSASIDMLTMSLPGLGGRWAGLRIPICTMDHSWVAKQ
eukprot:2545776-Lingulodinium_polyedra.AAC.1